MTVKQLIAELQECNPEAEVFMPGSGYTTEAGTWLEGYDSAIGEVQGGRNKATTNYVYLAEK